MLFKDVCIEAVSYLLPESEVTTSELESYLATAYHTLKIPHGTLEKMTGVQKRRLWPSHLAPSVFASQAAEKVLKQAGCEARDIDLILYTGVCRDFIEPSTAHKVHDFLKLSPHCMAFDLSNACLGFLNGMVLSGQMIEAGQIRKALVVSGENAAPLLEATIRHLKDDASEANFRSALASLTLGSGAAAMLLTHRSLSLSQHRLVGSVSQTASEHNGLCQGFGDYRNPIMKTDSIALLKEGVGLARRTWDLFMQELRWTAGDFAKIFTHQVSSTHYEKVFQELKLDSSKGRQDCAVLGNTGSVAAPLSLALANEEGQLSVGDKIALLGIGSGLSTMMLGVQW